MTQKLLVWIFSALTVATAASAQTTTHYETITADCWRGAGVAPWDYDEFSVQSPWSTTCTFADPLPITAKIVSIQAIPWNQYCGDVFHNDLTGYRISVNGEQDAVPRNNFDLGDHCSRIAPSGSYEYFSGKTYHAGDKNAIVLSGDGGDFNKLRIYSVDLTVAYTDGPQYFVQITDSTNPAGPNQVEKAAAPGATVTATIALGSTIGVKYVKKEPGVGGISTVVTLPTAQGMQTDVFPPPVGATLYENNVLLPFGPNTPGDLTWYFAVHLGAAHLDLLPTTASLKPVHLDVNVVPPNRLGDDPWDLDESLVTVAHNRGIPPQYLKGQIRQEGPPSGRAGARHFDAVNFRYEPCGQDLRGISRAASLINTAPYSTYKLDDAISAGTLVPFTPDDLDYRNKLSIPDAFDPNTGKPTHYRKLTDQDRNVLASVLWEANDKKNRAQNWSDYCGSSAAIAADPSILDFVAQTPTASTFGLFQIQFKEAVDQGWRGAVPDPKNPSALSQNPKYLIDRPEYIRIGGGSIDKGTSIDVRNFATTMASKKVCGKYQKTPVAFPAFFADGVEYERYLAIAIRGYNCALFDQNTGLSYGESVIYYSRQYLPVQPGPIF